MIQSDHYRKGGTLVIRVNTQFLLFRETSDSSGTTQNVQIWTDLIDYVKNFWEKKYHNSFPRLYYLHVTPLNKSDNDNVVYYKRI